MSFPALPICVDAAPAILSADDAKSVGPCLYCGQRAGLHAMRIGAHVTCVLCGLVQSLSRPTIDQEVRLIWLPEMSQNVLNVLVRQIHIDLRGLRESVYCEDTPKHRDGMQPVLYMAQRILLERGQIVSERLGSTRPSDLADALRVLALRRLPNRKRSLGGLRAFPAGRFYVGGVDVYGEIVDDWRAATDEARASPAVAAERIAEMA